MPPMACAEAEHGRDAMNANNRNLLAIALATVLLSPAAWAQKDGKGPPDMPRVEPAPAAPVPNSPERTMRDIHKPATTTTDQADTTLPPPSPPESQGAEHAAAHSSVVQRDLWTRLDSNGDVKISTSEGEADAAFDTDFSAMDTDDDGFVTDAEYRTAAKEDVRAGGADASSSASGRMGDVVRRLDANADGSISLSEGDADATIKSNFSSIDSNSDGMVSRAEYQAWLKASRK
jgi:Ca2+-binding EF-hand superfamily protein